MKIALDVDGVLVNYKLAYATKWQRAFGSLPKIKNKDAYLLWEYWDIPFLENKDLLYLEQFSDEEFWSNMPIIQSALDTCNLLKANGHDLYAVTACSPRHADFRRRNLSSFPLTDVICVGKGHTVSPKTEIINQTKPDFFVDDFIDYFHGIDNTVTKVLINNPKNPESKHVGMDEIHFIVNDLQDAFLKNIFA